MFGRLLCEQGDIQLAEQGKAFTPDRRHDLDIVVCQDPGDC